MSAVNREIKKNGTRYCNRCDVTDLVVDVDLAHNTQRQSGLESGNRGTMRMEAPTASSSADA